MNTSWIPWTINIGSMLLWHLMHGPCELIVLTNLIRRVWMFQHTSASLTLVLRDPR